MELFICGLLIICGICIEAWASEQATRTLPVKIFNWIGRSLWIIGLIKMIKNFIIFMGWI